MNMSSHSNKEDNNIPSESIEQLKLKQLKNILLGDDREELEQLKKLVQTPDLLEEFIDPIISERLEKLKHTMPKNYVVTVDNIVAKRLKESQSEILDLIYPVMGQMIKKYIAHQIQLLKDKIDHNIKEGLNSKSILNKVKSTIFGIKDSDLAISEIDKMKVAGIYVIQKESGLLIGSATNHNFVDEDVLAGMLTAIRSFAEDAFSIQKDNLELIEYGNFKIYFHDVFSFYYAFVVSGTIGAAEKEQLSEGIFEFTKKHFKDYRTFDEEKIHMISETLKTKFLPKF